MRPRSIPAASRPPAERTKSPADRQRHRPHLLGLIANALFQKSRQLVQASSRSRQRFRRAVAARQGSLPPRSSQGDRVVCRRRPRRWSRPYQSIWPIPQGSFCEPAAVLRRDCAPGPSPAPITHRERERLEMRCRALNTRVIFYTGDLCDIPGGPWGEVVHLHTASTHCPARCHATGLC